MKLAFSTRIDYAGPVVDTDLSPAKQGNSWESSFTCEQIIRGFFLATTNVLPISTRYSKGAADWQAVAQNGRTLDIEVKWSSYEHSFSLKLKDLEAHRRGDRCLMLSCYCKNREAIATYWLPPGSDITSFFEVTLKEGDYYILRPKDLKDI